MKHGNKDMKRSYKTKSQKTESSAKKMAGKDMESEAMKYRDYMETPNVKQLVNTTKV